MVCKSSVSVNHLHLHIQIFFTYSYLLLQCVYIYFLHLHKASVNICQIHFTYVNVLRSVSVNTKIICKVTQSLGAPFTPNLTLLSGVSIK
jgi:hypothetical protein